jgi:hypothetical protein
MGIVVPGILRLVCIVEVKGAFRSIFCDHTRLMIGFFLDQKLEEPQEGSGVAENGTCKLTSWNGIHRCNQRLDEGLAVFVIRKTTGRGIRAVWKVTPPFLE